ncbi:MAG: hypothetical protein SVK08_01030 [Halobacteriota archaeon]|nr:hypothetical protein [Halobacteriota archaeon]
MTDNTTTIAGEYVSGPRITCILDEGAPTVLNTESFDQLGENMKTLSWASQLKENDIVAISNDTANTFAATGGLPVVEIPVNGETLVIGKIRSTPQPGNFPANDAAADTLAERLAGGYYRTAVVEIWGGITAITKAVIMHNGTNALVPGVGTTLKYNITSGSANQKLYFDSEASGGVGVIPFHYVAAGSDGDTSDALVGITGLLIAATGA